MVLDLIIVIMFFVMTLRGKIHGFSESLIRLGGLVGGLVLGVVFTDKLSSLLIASPLSDLTTANLKSIAKSDKASITDFVPKMIDEVLNLFSTNFTKHSITHYSNIALTILSFLLIVLVVWIISFIIRKKLSKARKEKTLIGTVDSNIGLLFGMLKGLICVCLFLAFLFPLASIFVPDQISAINDSLNSSYIAGPLYDINPLIMFIRKLPL